MRWVDLRPTANLSHPSYSYSERERERERRAVAQCVRHLYSSPRRHPSPVAADTPPLISLSSLLPTTPHPFSLTRALRASTDRTGRLRSRVCRHWHFWSSCAGAAGHLCCGLLSPWLPGAATLHHHSFPPLPFCCLSFSQRTGKGRQLHNIHAARSLARLPVRRRRQSLRASSRPSPGPKVKGHRRRRRSAQRRHRQHVVSTSHRRSRKCCSASR